MSDDVQKGFADLVPDIFVRDTQQDGDDCFTSTERCFNDLHHLAQSPVSALNEVYVFFLCLFIYIGHWLGENLFSKGDAGKAIFGALEATKGVVCPCPEWMEKI